MKVLFTLFIASFCLLLNSCRIEGDEDILIRKDGSAHLTMRYQIPGFLFKSKDAKGLVKILDKELGHKKGVKLITNSAELDTHGMRIIKIELEVSPDADVKSLLQKKELKEKDLDGDKKNKSDEMLRAIVGEIDARVDGLKVGVVRDVNLEPLLEKYLGKGSLSKLGDAEFRYTVHLPEKVNQTNAQEVLDGGKTLKWVFLLRDSKTKPIHMTMIVPVPIPWWAYVLGSGVLLLIIVVGWWIWKKNRKKTQKSIAI